MMTRLLIALCLLTSAARIASADDTALRSAKAHFERGQKLYALAKFQAALDEYQLAFDAKPLADFLFNIGQCHRNLGDYRAAVFSYRKYLELAPDAANRVQVEQLISDLEAKQDRADAERLQLGPPPAPAPPPVDHPDPPLYKRWWLWTAVAVVGVAAGRVTIYETTRSHGPPGTDLGNIVFGK